MEYWVKKALEIGFSAAVPLDITTLLPMQTVRDACAADKCGAYGHNWTCPPACGTLKECAEKMSGYQQGILLQTIGKLQKTIDTKGYIKTERLHMKLFYEYSEIIRREYSDALCLGAGGCRICVQCAYPKPCRFPQKAVSSMESYGLFVTQVCRDNHLRYYYGPKTITYTACVLF